MSRKTLLLLAATTALACAAPVRSPGAGFQVDFPGRFEVGERNENKLSQTTAWQSVGLPDRTRFMVVREVARPGVSPRRLLKMLEQEFGSAAHISQAGSHWEVQGIGSDGPPLSGRIFLTPRALFFVGSATYETREASRFLESFHLTATPTRRR